MPTALVTGASGFVGSHLCEVLLARGVRVIGTFQPGFPAAAKHIEWVPWSLGDQVTLRNVLREHKPSHVYHLASPAHVPTAGQNPSGTIDAILTSTVKLLEVVREARSVERLLYASSAEVYAEPKDATPLAEDALIDPRSIYGICKSAASQWLMAQAPDLVTVVRPFNQIGPGQSPAFAIASFAEQLARIERKEAEPLLQVGNLDVVRDFSDVRDSALAHVLAAEKGRAGVTYNIASGVPTRVRDLLEAMLRVLSVKVSVDVDPRRVRPNEPPVIVGDATLIRRTTGWKPMSSAAEAALAALRLRLNSES